jgi:integrase
VASYDGGPKSKAGKRTLDLPPPLLAILRAHRADQAPAVLSLADAKRGGALVCTGELGHPIGYRNLTRSFKRLCRVAGVRPIRLYDLRHTGISVMAERGADIKAISEVAGHANVLITRNVYQHVNRNQRAAALAALTEALGEPSDPSQEGVS